MENQAPPLRSESNIKEIESYWSSADVVDNFLSEKEVLWVQSVLEDGEEERVQGLGDYLLTLKFFDAEDRLSLFIQEKLKERGLNDFEFREINHFKIERPYGVHSDAGKEAEEVPYKNLVIWLDASRDTGGLILFKQRTYFSWSMSNAYKENYNFIMNGTNPEYIAGYNSSFAIDPHIKETLLAHVHEADLIGLEIEQVVPYQKNRAVIFDSCQLHCTASSSGARGWKTGIMVSLAKTPKDPLKL